MRGETSPLPQYLLTEGLKFIRINNMNNR